jgi:hypothetical protein
MYESLDLPKGQISWLMAAGDNEVGHTPISANSNSTTSRFSAVPVFGTLATSNITYQSIRTSVPPSYAVAMGAESVEVSPTTPMVDRRPFPVSRSVSHIEKTISESETGSGASTEAQVTAFEGQSVCHCHSRGEKFAPGLQGVWRQTY